MDEAPDATDEGNSGSTGVPSTGSSIPSHVVAIDCGLLEKTSVGCKLEVSLFDGR